jgi:hypothetical protein
MACPLFSVPGMGVVYRMGVPNGEGSSSHCSRQGCPPQGRPLSPILANIMRPFLLDSRNHSTVMLFSEKK